MPDVPIGDEAAMRPTRSGGRHALPRRTRLPRPSMALRLFIAMLVCLLPMLGLQAWEKFTAWQARKDELGQLAVHQARLLGGNVHGMAERTRLLLGAAAQYQQVRILGPQCSERLATLRGLAEGHLFIARLDAAGVVACASDPRLLGLSGEAWTEHAQAAGAFGAGLFARTAAWPDGFLPLHLPLAAGQQGGGVIVAAVDPRWLERQLQGLKRGATPILASGVLTIADAAGTILARDTRHEDFVGRPFPPAAMSLTRAELPGTMRLQSIDGTFRVVGYTPPIAENHGLSSVVGFFEPDLMAELESTLWRNGLLLAAASALALLLTMLLVRRFVTRPARDLVRAAERWREGDLAARAPSGQGSSEFARLGVAFNDMAGSLQRRDEELRCHARLLEQRVAERTAALRDANERLRIEVAERRSAEAALLHAQKVQAVGRLAGGIAHDFNNVLQAVTGAVAMMRRRAADPVALDRSAAMAQDAVRRGRSVTSRLLAFARREELEPGTLRPAALLGELRDVLAATLGASAVRLDMAVPQALPPVAADRGQLEMVLINLAANARDAMPQGGTLRVEAAIEDAAGFPGGHAAYPAVLPPGRYLRVTLADSGAGMDAEVLRRATEPFFTTKPIGQGTGLGLAMARSFAERSGGALRIDSATGRGTAVSLWLPANEDLADTIEPESCVPVDHAARAARLPPLRLLVVDDDAAVRATLTEELAAAGHAVAQAADADAALRLLAEGGEWDGMITDLAMPGMDGMELIRTVRRQRPGLPAVLLTGFAGEAEALARRAPEGGGAFSLVRKPASVAKLLSHIAGMMERREETAGAG